MIQVFHVKDLRENNFWTQSQIAKKLNINRRTYAEYELQNNSIPLSVLCDLAVIYDVSIQYICGLTKIKKPINNNVLFNYELFLENLINLRKNHGYSQQDLAIRLNCSQSIISDYETNFRKISIETIILLAHLYDLPIDLILKPKNK